MAKPLTALQPILWPEAGPSSLFFQSMGAVARGAGGLRLFSGARVDFNAWFNLINLGTWQRHCDLRHLALEVEGEGTALITLSLDEAQGLGRTRDLVLDLVPGAPHTIDLSDLLTGGRALLSFAVTAAQGPLTLTRAAWVTQDAPKRRPDLTLAITTFRREAAVAQTVARFAAYREMSPLKDHLAMIVTDNGQSLDLDPPDGVRVMANENLGGAGGFTRGLLEAKDAGASHVVFMDDDASIYMDSLHRTWACLAYARDDNTAIAGAMATEKTPYEFWEYGCLFFTQCQPQYMHWDMRGPGSPESHRRDDLRKIEHEIARVTPPKLYGGWWYFAFPLAHARHLAFPFFVRGDDVSFSLANDFNIVRLNGVISYQESFTDKESPQTWYLDLRSHMAHHLSLPHMDIGRAGVLKIALKFFLKNLARMHYDTLSALTLALRDVTAGPDFFDQNADMAQRRADLKALTRTEAWAPLGDQPLPPLRFHPPGHRQRLLMKLSINGLLIPFYRRLGAKITLDAPLRGSLGHVWGASEITVLSGDGSKCYTVRHSKARALKEAWAFGRAALAFWRAYPRLSAAYRAGYARLTSEEYWRDKLGMTK